MFRATMCPSEEEVTVYDTGIFYRVLVAVWSADQTATYIYLPHGAESCLRS